MHFRDFHKNVKIRILVMFAFGMVQATTMPFMAIYFARNFGEIITGELLAIAVLASMISGAVGGYYADRIGRRKIMIWSELVFLIAYLCMAISNSPWFNAPFVTFLAFMVTNVCWGVYGPADEAMLLDVTTSEARPLMYSIFYWLHNLTMAVGASIGAVLFESYRFELFGSMAIVILGTLLTTMLFIEETYIPILHGGVKAVSFLKGFVHNYVAVLKDSTFVVYVLAGVATMSVEFQLQNFIGIHLAKTMKPQYYHVFGSLSLHIDGVKMLGLLQTENTVMVVLLAATALKLGRRLGDRWVLGIAILLNALGYSMMTFVHTPSILFGAMFVATVGEVLGVPVRQTYLGDIAPNHARSSYVALNGMTFSGAQMVASFCVILGAYMPAFGMGILSMSLGVLGMFLYQTIVAAVHHRRLAEESPLMLPV